MFTFKIKEPRWHDRVVLLATYNVTDGTNRIEFTEGSFAGRIYEIDGTTIRNCPIDTNGKIPCYAVPISLLSLIQTDETEEIKIDAEEKVSDGCESETICISKEEYKQLLNIKEALANTIKTTMKLGTLKAN